MNEPNDSYSVYIDGDIIIDSEDEDNPVNVVNGIVKAEADIIAGQEVTFRIAIGPTNCDECASCFLEFKYTLDVIPPTTTRTIDSSDGKCIVEETCGDNTITREVPRQMKPCEGTFDKGGPFNWGWWGNKCVTPIYCNGEQVGTEDIGMTNVYGAEYEQILRSCGFSDADIDLHFSNNKHNWCTTYRMCLAAPFDSWVSSSNYLLSGSPVGFFTNREECKFYCAGPRSGPFYVNPLSSLVGHIFNSQIVTVPECEHVEQPTLGDFIDIDIDRGGNDDFDPSECGDEVEVSLYQMYLWYEMDGFVSLEERFEGSQLEELLKWYRQQRGVGMPTCKKITLCSNNFQLPDGINKVKDELNEEKCDKTFDAENYPSGQQGRYFCGDAFYCSYFQSNPLAQNACNPNSSGNALKECGIYKINLTDWWHHYEEDLERMLNEFGISINDEKYQNGGRFDINLIEPCKKIDLLEEYIYSHNRGGTPEFFESIEVACATANVLDPAILELDSRKPLFNFSDTSCDSEEFVNVLEFETRDGNYFGGAIFERNDSLINKNLLDGMNNPIEEYLSESANIEFAFVDVKDSTTISAARVEVDKNYQIRFETNRYFWERSISSTNMMSIKKFHKSTDGIFMGGIFTGDLKLDQSILANTTSNSIFVSKLDILGNPLKTIVIENVNPNAEVIFSEDRQDNTLLTASYLGGEIIINGSIFPTSGVNGIFTASIDPAGKVKLLDDIRNSTNEGQLQVLDLTYSRNASQYTVLVSTDAPNIDLNGTNISTGAAADNLVMLRMNSAGYFEQSHSIDAANIKKDKFDATYGTNNQLLTGITFENTLSLPSNGSESETIEISSAGGEDVAILGFDRNGQLNLQETYGSTSNENISQMLFDNDVLSFAGQFVSNGTDKYTEIGYLGFSGGECNDAKVYVSFIHIDPPFSDPGECKGQALIAIEDDLFYQVNNEEIIEGLGEDASSYEHYAPSDGARRIGDAVTDSNKDVLTTGSVNHSETQSSLEIGKKTPDGDFAWTKSYQSTSEETSGNGIALDNAGNVVVAGQFANDLKISDSKMLQASGGTDAVINKLNEEGEEIWTKQVGSTGNDAALSVGAGSNGAVFATGYITGSATFDELTTSTPTGRQSLFLAKYSSDGAVEWVKTGESTNNTADFENSMLVTDSEGNVIVAGDYTGTFRLEGSSTPLTADGSLGKASFIAKYSPDGQVLWSKSVGKGAEMHLTSIVIDDQDNVTVAGEFSGLNDFAEGEDLLSNGGKDIFFAKFDKAGKMFWLKQQGEENDEVIHDLTTDGEGRFAYVSTATGSTTLEGEIFDAEEGTDNCITIDFNCDAEVESEVIDATCGEDNGVIDLTISGSSENYYFEWSHEDQMTEDLGALGAGEYTVTITDDENCAFTRDYEVKAIPPFAASATPQAATCEQSNGYIILDITGGNPPFTYAWSTGEETKNISGLAPNTFTVTITDQDCSKTLSVTIEDTPKPVVTPHVTNATCGRPNGSIILDVEGTTGPYSYYWSPNRATTKDLDRVRPDLYVVTVTDANNCAVQVTGIVVGNDETEMEVDIDLVSGSCNSGPFNAGHDGALNITVVDGTSSYGFTWSRIGGSESGYQPSSNNTISIPLPPGDYALTISDNNYDSKFCDHITTVTVPSSDDGGPVIQGITSNPTACDQNTGSASVSVTGGGFPYTYEWSTGTSTLSNVGVGTYGVTITAQNGCKAVGEAVIEQYTTLEVSTNSSNATCSTCANGSASASATNSQPPYTSPYTYEWSTGAIGEDVNGLLPGTYKVTVTDRDGCEKVEKLIVGYDILCDITIDNTVSISSCGNCEDGSISLTVTGGTDPYQYEWSTGATSKNIDNLLPGTYSVIVTDANGCTATAIIEVANPEDCMIEATFIVGPSDGPDYNNRSITTFVTAGSGTPPYTFEWSNGATTSGLFNIAAGTYELTITDFVGCTANYTVVVEQPDCDLEVDIFAQPPFCKDGKDGVLTATVRGGTPPYSYEWRESSIYFFNNNDVLSEIASVTDITPGVGYEVEVTDGNGCKAKKSGYVENPPGGMFINVEKDFRTTTTGYILEYDATIEVTGGTPPYTYFWFHNGSNNTPSEVGLQPGVNYMVLITDAAGCSKQIKIFEKEDVPPPPDFDVCGYSLGITSDIDPCSNQVNGTLTAIIDEDASNDGPYNFLWSTGETGASIIVNSPGTYSVETSIFQGGCKQTTSITIGEGNSISVNASANDATASVSASVSGGTPPYDYQWSNGATGNSISDLPPGSYTVSVTDAQGCTGNATTVLNEPTCNISVNLVPKRPSCFGYADGSVIAEVTGNSSSYTFNWSNQATTSSISSLKAGTYSVVVTSVDNPNCQTTRAIVLEEPKLIKISLDIQDETTSGGEDGSITANVSGGTSPYTYDWGEGRTGAGISDLAPESYSVVVTDDNGCQANST